MNAHGKRLEGKTALLTAAGQGIGRATAELFAREGAQVWATDINVELLNTLTGCQYAVLDVRDSDAVHKLAAKTGPVDVLFNCAGAVSSGTVLESSEDELQRLFDINVVSMVRLIKAYLPGMLAKKGGSIINVASVVGAVKGAKNRFVYGTTKAAIAGLTRSVASDFVERGVRCNAICPGTVETPSLHERLKATGDFDGALAAFKARQPMGRLGRPEEIAALALYLASDESTFTTGQCHVADGGWAG